MITQHRSPTAPLIFVCSLLVVLVAPFAGVAADRMSLVMAGAIGLVLAAAPARRWLMGTRARRPR